MEIKKIKEADFKELKKMQNYAFGKWKEEIKDDKKLDWYKNALNLGVYDNDKLVSGLTIHDFEQVVRKDVKRMGGIGGVATYPEYRNRGLVSSLMRESFNQMKKSGQSVSMLLPFKESFYEKYGYISTNNNMKLDISLNSLSHYRNYKAEGNWQEIRKDSDESREDFLFIMRKTALQKYHGTVLLDNKSKGIWHLYSKDNIFIFIKKDDKLVAASKYTKKGFRDVFETGVIDISNMYWTDLDSRNMLFKYFAKHLDQIERIKMFVPYGADFYSWFKNNKKIKVDIHAFPWMVRIIDIKDALSGIEVDNEGTAVIKVVDKFCSWNNKNLILQVKDSMLNVKETEKKEDIEISISALSALLYGSNSFIEIDKKYSINYKNESKRNLLKNWFPKKMIFNPCFF